MSAEAVATDAMDTGTVGLSAHAPAWIPATGGAATEATSAAAVDERSSLSQAEYELMKMMECSLCLSLICEPIRCARVQPVTETL